MAAHVLEVDIAVGTLAQAKTDFPPITPKSESPVPPPYHWKTMTKNPGTRNALPIIPKYA
jgi:hypothetical protein